MPVHRDQLRTQRSVSSMGSLYLHHTIHVRFSHQMVRVGPSGQKIYKCVRVGSGRVHLAQTVKYQVKVIHCTAFTVQFPTHEYEVQRIVRISLLGAQQVTRWCDFIACCICCKWHPVSCCVPGSCCDRQCNAVPCSRCRCATLTFSASCDTGCKIGCKTEEA